MISQYCREPVLCLTRWNGKLQMHYRLVIVAELHGHVWQPYQPYPCPLGVCPVRLLLDQAADFLSQASVPLKVSSVNTISKTPLSKVINS